MSLYDILGVTKDASAQTIKEAYRKLVKQYHPDANAEPGAADRFKEITAAYEILSDGDKRRQYDMRDSGFNGPFMNINMQDLINNMYRSTMHNLNFDLDIHCNVTLTWAEIYDGVTKDVVYTAYTLCDHCDGIGFEPGITVENCDHCNGTGHITNSRTFNNNIQYISQLCPVCFGSGKKNEEKYKCTKCNGQRYLAKEATDTISFPPGLSHNIVLKVPHQGKVHPTHNAIGDLLIHIIEPSAPTIFKRTNHLNIEYNIPVNIFDYIAGINLDIELPNGQIYTHYCQANEYIDPLIQIPDLGFAAFPHSHRGIATIKLSLFNPLHEYNSQQINDIITYINTIETK